MKIFNFLFLLAAAAPLVPQARAQAGEPPRARVAVLAELFTSEGCSSCPPADAFLRRLIGEQPIDGVEVIALSEHVDYWNRLGWRDPFSSKQFSERQSAYARVRQSDRIYTPQLVIDGNAEVVGSDAAAAHRAILAAARAPHARLQLEAARDGIDRIAVRLEVSDIPREAGGALRAMAALVEDGLAADVTRGENANRRLRHDAVVRDLRAIGDVAAQGASLTADFALDAAWAVEHLRVVAFLQDSRTLRVMGAATAPVR